MVGKFKEKEDSPPLEREVTIGKPMTVHCPEHRYSYGQYYSWGSKESGGSNSISLSETRNRFTTPNGTLVFTWLSADNVKLVNTFDGVSCKMEGGNTIYRSRKINFKVVGQGEWNWDVEVKHVLGVVGKSIFKITLNVKLTLRADPPHPPPPPTSLNVNPIFSS